MKFVVSGFKQDKLLEYGLDNTDAEILRWFQDFLSTGGMHIVIYEDEPYYYIAYGAIIRDLPAIGITSKRAIRNRFHKYLARGLMKKHVPSHKQRAYFALTALFRDLHYDAENVGSNYLPRRKSDSHVRRKSTSYDPNIIYPNTSIPSSSCDSSIPDDDDDDFANKITKLYKRYDLTKHNVHEIGFRSVITTDNLKRSEEVIASWIALRGTAYEVGQGALIQAIKQGCIFPKPEDKPKTQYWYEAKAEQQRTTNETNQKSHDEYNAFIDKTIDYIRTERPKHYRQLYDEAHEHILHDERRSKMIEKMKDEEGKRFIHVNVLRRMGLDYAGWLEGKALKDPMQTFMNNIKG